jgi:hypothetical protein
MMQEVKWNGEVLARHITEDDWAVGLSFFSADQEFVQVGTWRYDNGKQLLAHAHNEAPRTVPWTQEVLFVRKGRIEAQIYNPANEQIATLKAGPGDVLILLAGGHGYTILEDDTRVLEIKNGPYLGAEADRRRL